MNWKRDGEGGCYVTLPFGGTYAMKKFQGIFVLVGQDREILGASTNINHLMARVKKEAVDVAAELEAAAKELKEFGELKGVNDELA